jgi:hypothetical protein
MDVEIGTKAVPFLFWEYINRNFFAMWVLQGLRSAPREDNNIASAQAFYGSPHNE